MTEKPKTIICRVCLRSDNKIRKKCMSLFEKYKNGLIADTINSLANVAIKEGDGLPTKICPDCLLELDAAVNFKSKCETSNELLKNTVIHDGYKPDSTSELELDIKKEEPLDHSEDYVDVEFMNEDYCVDPRYNLEVTQESQQEQILAEKPKKSKAIDLKLECHDCGGFFRSKCKLKVHWKKVHFLENLICPTCKRTFKSYKAYNKHMNSNNNPCMIATKVNIEGVGKQRIFHCKDCKYHSRRIKDIQSHLYIHSGVRPYECSICHKTFTQQSSLQGHQEVSHKMFKVEATCQYCGKYLRGRNSVYRHLKLHREKGVQCDICKKMLRNKKNLILHLTRHTGVKMFTCELCASSFYTLSELCNHKRMIHEKGKHIYKCDICNYTSYRSETLKKHKKRHTGSNICCQICGFFVPNTEALALHHKRHLKKFQCPHCELKYARKDSLHKHVKAKHKFTFCSLPSSKPIVVKTETPPANVHEELIEIEVEPINK